jgi:hypothetical protein
MTGKVTTVFLAAMFTSQVALTAVSFADGKKSKSGTTVSTTVSSTVTSFKAKLAPPTVGGPIDVDLNGECEGEAKYKKKVTTKTPPLPALPTTSTEESFSGEVECPILTDLATAQADVYDMHLARGGADYAICTLVIEEIEFEYQSGNPPVLVGIEGEYAVKISQKTVGTPPITTLKQKIGGCTILATGLSGVPVVQDLDTVTVFLNGGLTPVLTGTFGVGSFDDDDDD